jgi:hypothetical protein
VTGLTPSPSPSAASATDRLAEILRSERGALLSGQFHRLPDLTEIKTALVQQMSAGARPEDVAAIRHAGRLAAGNLRLIAAAKKGLQDARRRMEMILRAGRSLDTYDALGRSTAARLAEARIERRA